MLDTSIVAENLWRELAKWWLLIRDFELEDVILAQTHFQIWWNGLSDWDWDVWLTSKQRTVFKNLDIINQWFRMEINERQREPRESLKTVSVVLEENSDSIAAVLGD